MRYDSTHYVQIESKSKRFWGSSSDTLALHITPDPQLKVAGVHLAAAPPCLAGGRTSDTGNKMWEGHERRRRGHPLTVAANGTSHFSSPTSNLAPSTSTLTHRHQSQWWHHPQTLKGIFKPNRAKQTRRFWERKLAASTSSTSLNRWNQIQRVLGPLSEATTASSSQQTSPVSVIEWLNWIKLQQSPRKTLIITHSFNHQNYY